MVRLRADEHTFKHIPTSLKGRCESKHGCSEAEHSWIFKYSTFLDLGNRWEDIWIGARNHAGMYAMMLVPTLY